ncbi:PepSY domain-containing protein [Thiolapillus sp.]
MGRLILAICSIPLLLTWQGSVADDDDHERVYEMLHSGEIISLEKILKIGRQQVAGKVIEVELEREKGALIYELEILSRQGKVWDVEIDAVSGKVLKVKED